MRTQIVDYAVHSQKVECPGTGYSDCARLILHVGRKALLFGRHAGRTLTVEFFTTGFLLRFRMLQTS